MMGLTYLKNLSLKTRAALAVISFDSFDILFMK